MKKFLLTLIMITLSGCGSSGIPYSHSNGDTDMCFACSGEVSAKTFGTIIPIMITATATIVNTSFNILFKYVQYL